MKQLSIIVLIAISVALGTFYFKSLNKPTQSSVQPSPLNTNRIYTSKAMKFSIEVPSNYSIQEKFATVTIVTQGKIIHIDTNGTNFTDLDQYLESLSRNNKLIFLNLEKLSINKLSAVKTTIQQPREEKIYFIHTPDWTVYSISTTSLDLYNEIDQIAQSFKYIP